jgi:hypothetical protein
MAADGYLLLVIEYGGGLSMANFPPDKDSYDISIKETNSLLYLDPSGIYPIWDVVERFFPADRVRVDKNSLVLSIPPRIALALSGVFYTLKVVLGRMIIENVSIFAADVNLKNVPPPDDTIHFSLNSVRSLDPPPFESEPILPPKDLSDLVRESESLLVPEDELLTANAYDTEFDLTEEPEPDPEWEFELELMEEPEPEPEPYAEHYAETFLEPESDSVPGGDSGPIPLAPPPKVADYSLTADNGSAIETPTIVDSGDLLDSSDPFALSEISGTSPVPFDSPPSSATSPILREERRCFSYLSLVMILFSFFAIAGLFSYIYFSERGEPSGQTAENLIFPGEDEDKGVKVGDFSPKQDLKAKDDFSLKNDADIALALLSDGKSPPPDRMEQLLEGIGSSSDLKSVMARFKLVSELSKHIPKYNLDLGAFYDPLMSDRPPGNIQKDPSVAWEKYMRAKDNNLSLADKRLSDLQKWAGTREADAYPGISDFRSKALG